MSRVSPGRLRRKRGRLGERAQRLIGLMLGGRHEAARRVSPVGPSRFRTRIKVVRSGFTAMHSWS